MKWNLPNKLTIIRVLLVPVYCVIYLAGWIRLCDRIADRSCRWENRQVNQPGNGFWKVHGSVG